MSGTETVQLRALAGRSVRIAQHQSEASLGERRRDDALVCIDKAIGELQRARAFLAASGDVA
jgi:hypothetical protein